MPAVLNNKIVLLSTGQPSTNPRLMKEVDSLLANGFSIKVYYSFWAGWARATDRQLLAAYPPGIFEEVGGSPWGNKLNYFISRLLHKAAKWINMHLVEDYAISRASYFLIKAALKNKASLYIAHNLGALPAAARAAKKYQSKYAFDAEDYHRGEFEEPAGAAFSLTKRIEEKYMPGCNYITAASPLIATAYKKILGRELILVNNVFSKKYLQENKSNNPGLSFFWFSQTIGPGRGLEIVLTAIANLECSPLSVHLLGDCSENYKNDLVKLIGHRHQLNFIRPIPPEDIFALAARFDIGIASELPITPNHNFCLANKIFTYLLAGNYILASNTAAQQSFLEGHPSFGTLYNANDSGGLAAIISKLFQEKEMIIARRQEVVQDILKNQTWEMESVKFINAVMKALNKYSAAA